MWIFNPMNWPALAIVAALAFGVGWYKGDAHGDRQCEARIERERVGQEKAIKDAAAKAEKEIADLQKEIEERDVQIAILDAETDADPASSSCGISPDGVRRINRSRSP